MDGFINTKIEKHTIYEIYRACRLCGAGAGYKMPIIQNVVDLDGTEVELKQKVRECVQIEVHQDDKMPPLICELCVDKVNDFYEFLEMCRQTNNRTRLRLGLPPQTLPRGAPDAGDCILGVTEPIFVENENSDGPIMRSKSKSAKSVKVKKEPDSRDRKNKNVAQKKDVTRDTIVPRTLRSSAPSPPRLRGTKRQHEDEVSLSRLQKARKPDPPMPKSILKRERDSKTDDAARLMRPREKDSDGRADKRVKIVVKPIPHKPEPPRSAKSKPSTNVFRCQVCRMASFDNIRSLNMHVAWHNNRSLSENKPPLKKEPRRMECKQCQKQFPNKNLLGIHRCGVKSLKPAKPSRLMTPPKPAPRSPRRQTDTAPKKKSHGINPMLLKTLRQFQVRVARCDPLLASNRIGEHFYVSDVDCDFGLDKNCSYPYMSSFQNLCIKSEPSYMVNIHDEIKKAFDIDDSYVHWDSENETDSDLESNDTRKVGTLSSLTLKTIFSDKFLGKVPKKRRKAKVDKAFDSILNATDFDKDLSLGISDIIHSLADDKETSATAASGDAVATDVKHDRSNNDNDSLFGDDKAPVVTNDDFDSLFNNKDISNVNNNDKSVDVKSCNDSDDFNCDDSNKAVISNQDSESNNELNSHTHINAKKDDSDLAKDSILNSANSESLDSKVLSKQASDVREDVNENQDKVDNSTSEIENDNHLGGKSATDISIKDINSSLIARIDNNETASDREGDGESCDKKKLDKSEQVNDRELEGGDCTEVGAEAKSEDASVEVNKTDFVQSDTVKSETNSIVSDLKMNNDNHINSSGVNHETLSKDDKCVNGQLELTGEFDMDDLEDVSDSEIDDSRLMQALDAQINESGTANAKSAVCESDRANNINDILSASVSSMDLESISDGDFE